MADMFALESTGRAQALDALRSIVVCGCALVLIVAGRALPF